MFTHIVYAAIVSSGGYRQNNAVADYVQSCIVTIARNASPAGLLVVFRSHAVSRLFLFLVVLVAQLVLPRMAFLRVGSLAIVARGRWKLATKNNATPVALTTLSATATGFGLAAPAAAAAIGAHPFSLFVAAGRLLQLRLCYLLQ